MSFILVVAMDLWLLDLAKGFAGSRPFRSSMPVPFCLISWKFVKMWLGGG